MALFETVNHLPSTTVSFFMMEKLITAVQGKNNLICKKEIFAG